MNIFLAINVTRPDDSGMTALGKSGDSIQEGFTNLFAAFDTIRCVFFGLFTGVWC